MLYDRLVQAGSPLAEPSPWSSVIHVPKDEHSLTTTIVVGLVLAAGAILSVAVILPVQLQAIGVIVSNGTDAKAKIIVSTISSKLLSSTASTTPNASTIITDILNSTSSTTKHADRRSQIDKSSTLRPPVTYNDFDVT